LCICAKGSGWTPSAIRSAPVNTAITPGAWRAAVVSIRTMRACAYCERAKAQCAWFGRLTSSVNVPRPVMRCWSSRRRTGLPIHWLLPGWRYSGAVLIVGCVIEEGRSAQG
jgi:hypothetical protein